MKKTLKICKIFFINGIAKVKEKIIIILDILKVVNSVEIKKDEF